MDVGDTAELEFCATMKQVPWQLRPGDVMAQRELRPTLMPRWIAVLLAGAVLLLAANASDESCPVCGNRYTKNIYRATRVGSKDKVLICEKCAKLDTICYICRLPVARNYTTCADGRLICQEDAARAVMDQDTAEKLFDQAKVWCQSTFAQYGALPNFNVRMSLEAKSQLDRTGNLISDHPDALLMGITRTKQQSDQSFEHVISLLHGLVRPRFLCVSVHEYAHTWLHENMPGTRRLSGATIEGFCEWLAYKYAVEQQMEQEQLVITKNPYSRGQVHAFIAAEKEYGLYRVIEWMKFGAATKVDGDDLTCIIRLAQPAEAAGQGPQINPLAPPPAVARAPVAPEKLLLKGISGTAARRFALINGQTFMTGEQAKVRVGSSNVIVRCLEIRDKSVVVQLASGAKEELLLETR